MLLIGYGEEKVLFGSFIILYFGKKGFGKDQDNFIALGT